METLCGEVFDPSKFDSKSPKMRSAVINALKEFASVSNMDLKRNAETLMYKKNISDEYVEWLNGVNHLISEKFILSY